MTRELIYMAGFVVLTGGLALGAYFLGVPPEWLAVIVLVMAGLGIIRLARTSQRPPAKPRPQGWFPEDEEQPAKTEKTTPKGRG